MKLGIWTLVTAIITACCGYGLLFLLQERAFKATHANLKPVPPVQLLRVATGYGRQLAAEVIFVQASVFVGGLHEDLDPQGNAPVLAYNYLTTAQLYPEFRDTYYHAQSFLAGLDEGNTRKTNEILAIARKNDRNNFLYPFFQGFNCFSYLHDLKQAVAIFSETSLIPDAPPFFEHMAILLRAEGGELEAGLASLQILVQTTDDQERRKKYEEEIGMFNQALVVQKAVNDFFARHQRYPAKLEELVPSYLTELPDFHGVFELGWQAPNVELHRPRVRAFEGVRKP